MSQKSQDPMGNVTNILSLVEFTLSLCFKVYNMAQNVKTNRERCQRIAQRVRALEELVLNIKQRGQGRISGVVENPLRELCNTLASAKGLMMKYSKRNSFKKFLRSSSHEDEFHMLNERLTNDHLILSGALQIDHGNMLHQAILTVSGRRQDEEYYSDQLRDVPIGTLHQGPPYGFTIPMHHPSNIPPLPMPDPTTPVPPPSIPPPTLVHYTVPPSPLSATFAPRPLSTTIVSRPAHIYYTTAPKSVLGPLAPMKAPMLLTRTIAPTTFSSQNTYLL
ncbi:uncharacterized protein LOC144463583 [Epinephelus lanceolatus]